MVDWNLNVPELIVQIGGVTILRVIVDEGSRVNIMSDKIRKSFGIKKLEAAPFYVRMAYQRRVQPLGIARDVLVKIEEVTFPIVFTRIQMEEST